MTKPASVKHEYAYPTEKQIAFAKSLAIRAGYPARYALAAARRDFYGKNPVSDIKRQECSELIAWLQAKMS